jgi:hypothetical protein
VKTLAFAGSLVVVVGFTTLAIASPESPLIGVAPSPPASIAAAPDPNEDEKVPPRPLLALAAGGLTSTASFATGIVIISRNSDSSVRNAALLGAMSGMTLAPVFAHMIVGETKRGLFFGLIPLATEIAMGGLMLYRPNLVTIAPVGVQYSYIALIAASIFGSAIGTLDAVRVDERATGSRSELRVKDGKERKPRIQRPLATASRVRAWPMVGEGMAGAMIGGDL